MTIRSGFQLLVLHVLGNCQRGRLALAVLLQERPVVRPYPTLGSRIISQDATNFSTGSSALDMFLSSHSYRRISNTRLAGKTLAGPEKREAQSSEPVKGQVSLLWLSGDTGPGVIKQSIIGAQRPFIAACENGLADGVENVTGVHLPRGCRSSKHQSLCLRSRIAGAIQGSSGSATIDVCQANSLPRMLL